MNNNFNIGERIYELRTKQGLSQEQLALCADITPTYLGLVERNLKNPTVKVIEKLCHALNISLAVFFSPSIDPFNAQNPTTVQILAQLNNRTQEEKQLILQIIKDTLKLRDLDKGKK